MKSVALALVLVLLGGAAQADPITTFRQICMANLGQPAAAIKAGKSDGFNMTSLAANSSMGFKGSSDESVQINVATRHAFECAVTTSDMANPSAVTRQFFEALGLTGKGGKAKGKVGGKTYTFLHDTKGGEAFVVYAD